MRHFFIALALLVPTIACPQTVDIAEVSGVGDSHKALRVSQNGVVHVWLASGQAALIQFTSIAEGTAEYRWKYKRIQGGEVNTGVGRVVEKYELHPTEKPNEFNVTELPGHDETIRAGEILAKWSSGGGEYCYFYYDSKRAHARVLDASAFDNDP